MKGHMMKEYIMKVIILTTTIVYLMGCSSYNTSLSKVKKKETLNNKAYMEERHMGSSFKSTLSSFMPLDSEPSNENMSWDQQLQSYLMDSNMILYGISFIVLIWLMSIGMRYKNNLKIDNKIKRTSRNTR